MTRTEIEERLRDAGIDEYKTEALLLLSRYGGVTPARLRAEPRYDCDSPALSEAVARRLTREPLDYIFGCRAFRNETYRVTPDVLIPRAETELLVERAAEILPRRAVVADLCTGSGCIAISLAAARPDITCDAFDVSPAALAVAEENAAQNGVADRVSFHKLDLLAAKSLPRVYAALLSNPPYIRSGDMKDLPPETRCEPRLALDGGDDGLRFYRHFLTAFRPYLEKDGAFLFEIGYDEGDALRALCRDAGYAATVTRDYEDRDRIVTATATEK